MVVRISKAAKKSAQNSAAEIVSTFNKAQDRLVLQASDMSLETVAAMVEGASIDTQTAYQRRERWTAKKQSALIESFLLNIPIPPVYLAEESYGKYSVIDGKQRLTSITAFMRGKIALSELEKFKILEGAHFEDLPGDLKNALKIRPYVRVITLLKQSDPDLKYEVFERLNTGGEALEAQEIRNAAFRGPFNDLLFELSEAPFLRQQLKIEKNTEPTYLQMQDVEYVLRFFTMKETWRDFSGDYRRSMDAYMQANQKLSKEEIARFRLQFTTSLSRCEDFWGEDAFKRYETDGVRNQFLAGMYDAQMVAASLLGRTKVASLRDKRKKIVRATRALFSHGQFEGWVRQATNTKSSVLGRIDAMKAALESVD